MEKAEEFMDLYRQLEQAVEEHYDIGSYNSPVAWLEQQPAYKDVRTELSIARDVRNLLSHNPKLHGAYAVEPEQGLIDVLRNTVERVSNPLRANRLMVPENELYRMHMGDPVLPSLRTMAQKGFSHLPILDENKAVIGVFSQYTLLAYLADHERLPDLENVTLEAFQEYLPLDKHIGETYGFVAKNTLYSGILRLFERTRRHPERLGMLFVTEHGYPNERLLGIITAADAAAGGARGAGRTPGLRRSTEQRLCERRAPAPAIIPEKGQYYD